jgi:hypothetical protein
VFYFTEQYKRQSCSPCLLLSSVGFRILVWIGKVPIILNFHYRDSSNELRGWKIPRKYIASPVNSTRHLWFLWICGYVHVYKIIKQLFHDCSLNRHEITVYYKKDMFINFLFTGKLCNELFAAPCLLLSSVGFRILVWIGKVPIILNFHYRDSSNELRGW